MEGIRVITDLTKSFKAWRELRGYKSALSFCRSNDINYNYYQLVESGKKEPSLKYCLKVMEKLDCKLLISLN